MRLEYSGGDEAGRRIGFLIGMVYLRAGAADWETGYQERLRKLVAARTWDDRPGSLG